MLTNPGTSVSSSPGTSSTSTTTSTSAGAQHRLMLKQTHIDVWSLREQLGLASAVLKAGDQNWVSVSRQMKPFSEEGRPHDWFSQKNCALQYKLLLEKVDTPRRKRGDKSEVVETPGEAIVRRLKAERLLELKRVIEQQASKMKRLEEEVKLLNDPSTPEDVIDEIEQREEEDVREEEEKQKAHAIWLAEREEKKMAIQAALKAHSAKLPLKGAAAAAVTAANIARRSSALSEERNSFSDVDSPLNHFDNSTVVNNSKSETFTTTTEAPVALSSPLLSSLLKSSTSVNSSPDKKQFEEPMETDGALEDGLEEVPSTEEVDNPVTHVENIKVEADKGSTSNGFEVETVSVSNVEEVKVESIEEKPIDAKENDEEMPHDPSSVQVLENSLNDDGLNGENEAEVEEATSSTEDVSNGTGDDKMAFVETVVDTPEQVQVKTEIIVENNDVENFDSETKLSTTINEEQKHVTGNDVKRPTRTSGSNRRQRNQSDVAVDDEASLDDAPLRRETRSKKISERSEEVSTEAAAEESPLPPPATSAQAAARETRRSAAKKSFPLPVSSSTTSESPEEIDTTKDDDISLTPLAENKRISRLKEKEATANRKTSRRGSGATASRSSSPVPSGDDESSELDLPRVSRARQKSGKPLATPTPPTADTPVDETSVPPSPMPTDLEISNEDAWIRTALSILNELTQHVGYEKITSSSAFETATRIAVQPVNVELLRKGLENGTYKTIHEFHAAFLMFLVSIIVSVNWESELLITVRSLFDEFKKTIQDDLLSFVKSVPPTPVKSKAVDGVNDATSVQKSKRDASGDGGVTPEMVGGVKRKRGSNSNATEESISAPATPTTKKRRRI